MNHLESLKVECASTVSADMNLVKSVRELCGECGMHSQRKYIQVMRNYEVNNIAGVYIKDRLLENSISLL